MSGECHEQITRRAFLRTTTAGAAVAGLGGVVTAAAPTTRPARDAGAPKLPSGVLGRTKYPVTLISCGAILLSDKLGTRILKAAIDAGVNLVHTSASYGRGASIRAVGGLFEQEPKYRDKVFLGLKSYHPEREEEIDSMLRDLHTDHADVVLTELHSPDRARLDAIRKQQDALKKKGKAKHTGFVCHGDLNEVLELVVAQAPDYFDVALLSTAMVPAPGGTDKPAADAKGKRFVDNVKALRAKNVGVLSMKSGARAASRRSVDLYTAHVKSILAAGADSVLTSLGSFEQVEMVPKLDLKNPHPTTREAQAAAEFRRSRADACLMCGDCTRACPSRLPVADLMRIRLYHDEYRWWSHARSEWGRLGLDATLAACGSDCSACTSACPVGLAGRDTVGRVVAQMA